MRALATKSTHRKKNYNKRELAKKLDKLADKVSKRAVFVVSKEAESFSILNYLNKAIVISEIPNYKIADILCSKLNSGKRTKTWLDNAKSLLADWSKLDLDCVYYTYTIQNSADEVIVDIVKMRKSLALGQMEQIGKKLKRL